VSNAHEELLEYYARRVEREQGAAGGAAASDTAAAATDGDANADASASASGSGALHLASEPCCGGILETLRLFGTAEGVAKLEDAELGADKAEELRRAREVVLGGALLAGGRGAAAASAADGATAATAADGRVVPFAEWAAGIQGAAHSAVEWIDQLRTRHAGEGVVVATYERWWWCCGGDKEGAEAGAGAAAATDAAAAAPSGRRACLTTAVLRRRPGPGCEMEVVHVHEGPAVVAAVALERLDELVKG
jgi:hypothetical protein